MSFVAGARVSLASAWQSHLSTPSPTHKSVFPANSCSKTLAPCASETLAAASSAGAGRPDYLTTADYGSYQKQACDVTASFSVAQPPSGVLEEEEEEAVQDPIIAPGTDVNSILEWELDFCSRPILDARRKKVWELLICDSKRNLQFSKFYPHNVINSLTLKDALQSVIQLGFPKPQKIRFFRSQMQNIISKACSELDIPAVVSRRCFSLLCWLDERYDTVYRQHPGFQESAVPLFQLEQSFPLELPDLRGDQWVFVQLPLPAY